MTTTEEVQRLRAALAGHLFDGESLSVREAVRSELITEGLKASLAVDRVTELHKPETRWTPYNGADVSYDTVQDAIEAAEDCDLGPCAESPAFFLVCAHCKTIEETPCEGECTKEAGYRESLWPCQTIKAIIGHVQCEDCGKCRTFSCERGPDCTDQPDATGRTGARVRGGGAGA